MNERRQPLINETWERYGRHGVITDVNLETSANDVTTGSVTVTWNDTGSQDDSPGKTFYTSPALPMRQCHRWKNQKAINNESAAPIHLHHHFDQ